jgi:hypothetical protein
MMLMTCTSQSGLHSLAAEHPAGLLPNRPRGSRPRRAPGSHQKRLFGAGLLPDDLPLPLTRCADQAFPVWLSPGFCPAIHRSHSRETDSVDGLHQDLQLLSGL